MILSDYHIHTKYSSDSEANPEETIQTAISRGLKYICFTDHLDIDFPDDGTGVDFQLDTAPYQKEIIQLKEKYKDQITVLWGVEMGLMTHIKEEIESYLASYPFDFAIGSSHLTNDKRDPYYASFYDGRTNVAAMRQYFEAILDNAKLIEGYQVYGHLDYAVRYCPDPNFKFEFKDYADIFEALFKTIIPKGVGIEMNTAGLFKGLGYPHPHRDILNMYKEMGGEIITIGSDAHESTHVGRGLDVANQVLLDAGFKYYTIFEEKKEKFLPL